jgi:hypothetical protein
MNLCDRLDVNSSPSWLLRAGIEPWPSYVEECATILRTCSEVKQGLLTIERRVCSQDGLAIGASHRLGSSASSG